MNWTMEPMHWFILGLALIVLEIFIPSFTIFWFGLAAIIVSALVWLIPSLALPVQIFIWVILSLLIMVAWFKIGKNYFAKDNTKAGLSREATIGQVGMVISTVSEHNEVTVRFPMPILGSDEWKCRCINPVNIGDRVMVTDILGNQLVVIPHSSHNKN